VEIDSNAESEAVPEIPDPDIVAIQQSLLEDEPGIDDTPDGEPEAEPEVAEAPISPSTGEPVDSEDGVAEAAAQAHEDQLEMALDVAVEQNHQAEDAPGRDGVVPIRRSIARTIWPFIVYDVLWVGFVVVLTRTFLALPEGVAVFEAAYYQYALWAGLALLALGPLLILIVWLVLGGQEPESAGTGTTVLVAGSVATLIGAVMWWGSLMVVDYIRLGSVY
jgi:hypothetical protein